jgi:hypothetical protein
MYRDVLIETWVTVYSGAVEAKEEDLKALARFPSML